MGIEIKIGSLEELSDGWLEALKCRAILKVSEATGEPAKLATGFCNDDEAFHLTAGGRVFHVCYSVLKSDQNGIESVHACIWKVSAFESLKSDQNGIESC